jgi:hypothetical protein
MDELKVQVLTKETGPETELVLRNAKSLLFFYSSIFIHQ